MRDSGATENSAGFRVHRDNIGDGSWSGQQACGSVKDNATQAPQHQKEAASHELTCAEPSTVTTEHLAKTRAKQSLLKLLTKAYKYSF